MSDKHLQRNVNEFSGHQNIRELDSLDQRKMVVRQTDLKRLSRKDLADYRTPFGKLNRMEISAITGPEISVFIP